MVSLPFDDPKFYLRLLKRWWWLFLLAGTIAGGYAFYKAIRQPLLFQARSTVLVAQTSSNPNTNDYANLVVNERLAQNYAQLLVTQPVMTEVVRQTGITLSPDALKSMISIQSVEESQLIRIVVTDTDAVRASVVANVVPTVFSELNTKFQQERYTQSKQSLLKEIDDVTQQILELEGAIAAIGETTNPIELATISRLEALLSQYKTSYASVLRNYESVRLQEALSAANASLIIYEPARTPATQLPRNLMQNIAPTLMIGLALAGAFALAIEFIDDRVRNEEMLTNTFTLPVLASLQSHKVYAEKGPVTSAKPFSLIAESYRNLRTRILFSSLDKPLTLLQVTSAQQGEGKSTVVANLAVIFAQAEKRTLVIDGDLRLPTLHKKFNIDNQFGLTDALVNHENDWHNYVHASHIPNLYVLTSGKLPPNPSEVLGSERMAQLLEKTRQEYQCVIIDSAPVLAVSDPLILSRRVDATLLVCRQYKTHLRPLVRCLGALAEINANVIGLVLNDAKQPDDLKLYAKYYSKKGKNAVAGETSP
ncbi:MAG TPA: polysaccharide biosynthesis tyrosine autokinase [Anaerolineales bacterium]|nr:polysaccharide biosynthesis tyrosine autokinase [Anaerolineales bacterium]